MIFATHPINNPHKPEKVRRDCIAASKYQGVDLNHQVQSGPELLQSLIGIVFSYRRHQIALSAIIEAMFCQVAFPSEQ